MSAMLQLGRGAIAVAFFQLQLKPQITDGFCEREHGRKNDLCGAYRVSVVHLESRCSSMLPERAVQGTNFWMNAATESNACHGISLLHTFLRIEIGSRQSRRSKRYPASGGVCRPEEWRQVWEDLRG